MASSADHHRNHFYLHRSPSVGQYPMYYNGAQISDHYTPNFISQNPYPLSKLNSQCCNKFNCPSPTTGIKASSPDKINNLRNIITNNSTSSNGKSQSNFFPKSKWSLSKSVGHDIGGFTRKWSDFVPKFARRNVDNKVYRSESFRFIQKTDSFLSPRASVPLRGILKNGKQIYQRPGEVPVSDYIEPLDRLLLQHSNLNSTSISNNSNPSSATNTTASSSNSNTSNTSNTSSSGGKCINTSTSLSDKEYQEIKENCHNINYNAPYYYSDTLKEDPTYILPCSNTGTSTSSNKKPPPPLPTSPPPKSSSPKDGPSAVGGGGGFLEFQTQHQGRPGELLETSLDQSMARKKYETAFLPKNIQSSNNANKACSPSEVDALLMSIDSRPFFNNLRSISSNTNNTNNASNVVVEGEESILPDNFISNCTAARSRQPLTPQIELSDRPALELITPKININKPNNKNVHSTPLSEPLPCKRFSSIQSTSPNSSSTISSKDNARVSMMKDNSISSLESLGSTKSEDLSRLRSSQVRKAKLLSPISDKSPLEPTSSMHTLDTKDLHCNTHQWNTRDLLATSEYANVPWEMPKLKRKLALLADSGISLDSSGGEGGGSGCSNDGYQQIVQHQQQKPSKPPRGKMDFGRVNLELRLSGDDCDETVLQQQRYDEAGDLYLGDCEGQLADLNLQHQKPDRFRMKLDFNSGDLNHQEMYEIDTSLELGCQDWFFGAITRSEAESTLRSTKEGSFLVRNCESSTFNRYSLSIKSARGFIHIRIEPNSLGTFSLGENEFPTVAHLVLHFMSNRLPIKGAEHVRLKYPVITQLL